jgi:hypothetical protein
MIRHAHKTLSTTVPVEVSFEDLVNGVNTLIIQNISETDYIYIGNSAVSSTDYGFLLYPRQAFTAELRPNDKLYAVASGVIAAVCMSIERAT